MNRQMLDAIAQRLKAMADPTRLHVLQVLEDGELCVGDIVERVGSSQANVSKHLGVLKANGLVRGRREGMNVYYAVEECAVFDVCRIMCHCVERGANRELERVEAASENETETDTVASAP